MAEDTPLQPIIIKKVIKKVEGGHHGGAWKVAYADFVTAMMAFFMLMWLLNATTEKQRKGLADYFSPVIPIHKISAGGEGAMWGDSVFPEDTLTQSGTGATNLRPSEEQKASGDAGETGSESGNKGETGVAKAEDKGEEDQKSPPQTDGRVASEKMMRDMAERNGNILLKLGAMEHAIFRTSDRGLEIEIFDLPGRPLFSIRSDLPTENLVEALDLAERALDFFPNRISVAAHVSSPPLVAADVRVWERSAARANAVRLALDEAGFDMARLHRVTGYADKDPFEADPMGMRNNRIVITLLHESQ
jgi:chemotaxis protein MotB